MTANRKENVINALGRATAQLRARLGESLPSIQSHNAPLELATAPSLDALNITAGHLLSRVTTAIWRRSRFSKKRLSWILTLPWLTPNSQPLT